MKDDMISRQAALDALEWKWAGKAAIDAIKALPSAQPSVSKTEIVGDVISRQAAIDAVAEGLKNVFVENRDIAEKMIGKLPSAQPGWIPCKTALPEKGKYVLCQCRAGIMDVLRLTDDNGWYKDSTHIYMHGFVLAWMPLPKPWEGGQDENN